MEIVKYTKKSNATFFRRVRFLVAALSTNKDDYRFHVKHIQVTPLAATATDGSRLHQWLDCPLDVGFYRVVVNKVSEIILEKVEGEHEYPDWEDLFKTKRKSKTVDVIRWCEMFSDNLKNIHGIFADIIRAIKTDHLNFNYFVDVMKYCDDEAIDIVVTNSLSDGEWTCPYPILFKSKEIRAVIMPMRGPRK